MDASEPVFADRTFSVLTEPHGRALVVRTFGEIDIAAAKALDKEIRSAFESDAEAVLVDLGEVSSIDSAGLDVLRAATGVSNANGHRLRIVRFSSSVQRAIEASGLEGAFPLAD
jgi:anti-sigma B factor antagonist